MRSVRTILIAAAVHLAASSAPSYAFAQNEKNEKSAIGRTPLDQVFLKSGGLFRGTLIEVVPNVQARLQLITGEIATIPWSEIDHIERPGPATPGAAVPTAEAKAPAPVHVVYVHLDGADGARIQEDTTGSDDWATVCTAPCDKPLSVAFSYRIVGDSIRTSPEFTLHEESGTHQSIHVDPASRSAFTWGLVSAIVGGSVAYVGSVVVLFGMDLKNGTIHGTANPDTVIQAGAVMIGVGAVAGIAGLVAVFSNRTTSIVRSSVEAPADPSGAWLHPAEGGHAQEAAAERAAFPKTVGIPLFSGAF